jgi:putative tricarboxylic transport membrane protein
MNRHDMLSGLVWLALSIFVLMKALDLGVGALSNAGPGFVLFWSAIILGLLSMALLVKAVIGKEPPRKLGVSFKGLKWYKPVAVIVALFIYGALLNQVGFLLMTFLLMLLFYGLGKPKPWVTVFGALLTVLVAYVVFQYGLQLQLPRGVVAF